MTPEEYDVLNIESSEEILTPEELGSVEPEPVADDVPAEPLVVQPEEAGDPEPDDIAAETTEEPAAEPEDDLVNILATMRDTITAQAARIDALEQRLVEAEAREAARGRKLTGFFAPVQDGRTGDPDADPLPRIEKKYIY